MISYEQLPENNADLTVISVEFPYLNPKEAKSCPVSLAEVLEYLRLESPDGDTLNDNILKFCRTALVSGQHYWIWEFQEFDGNQCYVTVSKLPDNTTRIGYDENRYDLTPEQFMLGDYYNVF